MTTAVSFETVREWFKKCALNAVRAGKSDSATLWTDGLEHLDNMKADLAQAVIFLAKVVDSDMAQREEDEGNKSKLLTEIRKFIKKTTK